MPDVPDWSQYGQSDKRSSIININELAVRLGAPFLFDARGEAIHIDSFDYGLRGYTESCGTCDEGWVLDAPKALHGPFSARISEYAVGETENYLERWYEGLYTERVGFTACFQAGNHIDNVWLEIVKGVVTDNWVFQFQIDPDNHAMSYKDSNGDWESLEIPTNRLHMQYAWNYAKLAVDLETHEYLYVRLNDTEYSLGGIGGYLDATNVSKHVRTQFTFEHDQRQVTHSYCDLWMVTIGE
jgi:hypothetical protein